MAGSSGPVVGTTWSIATSAFWLGVASGTAATPSIASTSSLRSATSFSGSLLEMTSAVSTSGPLRPTPKCCEIRS